MSVDYKKEFFDREYTAREAYARIWPYVRKYIFRIVVGIVCGMLTAGTLVPIFSVVQPALEKVSRTEHITCRLAEEVLMPIDPLLIPFLIDCSA